MLANKTSHHFRVEYDYRPTPDEREKMSEALDLVIALILEDFLQHPALPSTGPTEDGPE
jgi:hypothetical protein